MLENNGYVVVRFEEGGKPYTFMIPPYIEPWDVGNWAVVEDSFYLLKPHDKGYDAPYCIVKVEEVLPENAELDFVPTAYIAATISSGKFKMWRNLAKRDIGAKNVSEKNLDSFFCSLPWEQKVDIIADLLAEV